MYFQAQGEYAYTSRNATNFPVVFVVSEEITALLLNYFSFSASKVIQQIFLMLHYPLYQTDSICYLLKKNSADSRDRVSQFANVSRYSSP